MQSGCKLFPLPLGSKQPFKNFAWKDYETNESEVVSATDMNWAMRTGKDSGLIVVDCDSREASEWVGDRWDWSQMQTVTPRGGIHLYFKYPGSEVRNKVRVHGLSVDIRGDGGYIMLPGSFVNGKEYLAVGIWDQIENLPVFKPEWIAEPKAARPRPSPIQNVAGAIKNIRNYVRRIESVQGCNGSKALMRACYVLADHFRDYDAALAELLNWNDSGAAVPPWSERELTHALQGAFTKKLQGVVS